jgi:hypothetical protein
MRSLHPDRHAALRMASCRNGGEKRGGEKRD